MWPENNRKNQFKIIALITVIDALTSQIYIDYLVNGFRVSVSVILLPVIYFYYRKINPVITSVFIGVFGLLFRSVVGAGLYGSMTNAFLMDYQILIFDVTYGILFYILFYHSRNQSMLKWFFSVWICDFTANLVEMTLRVGPITDNSTEIINTLITVGFFRTIIACFLVFAFKYYQIVFQKEAKYEKYRIFYTVFADLKSETYFMKENMDYIEDVMSEAYHLYEHLASSDDEKAKQMSLNIAKDVHEIKKNYNKVIDGINKIGKQEEDYDYLDLRELILLLHDYYEYEKTEYPITIEIEDQLSANYRIKKHFLLMSVLKNLIGNSVEALESIIGRRKFIHVTIKDTDDKIVVTVRDTGKGIKEKDIALIFEPGYSTKFNEKTGDIYRGLGLTLVKDIVTNQFGGNIYVDSKLELGTTFTVELDQNMLGD